MANNIGDTSRGALRFVEETTAGETPASALTELRITGEGLTPNYTNETSNEIRSDRQITDSILVGYDVSGNVDGELSYEAFDSFMEGALFDDLTTVVAVSETDISAAASDNSINTAAGDFTAENIEVGQWLQVDGFTTNGTSFFCRVVSVATLKLVVTGITLVDEGPLTITMKGQFLKNGTAEHYYTIETEYTDLDTPEFHTFKGMKCDTMGLSLSAQSIFTIAFGFMGLTHLVGTSTAGTGSPTAASTNDVFNASGNIANIRENGALLDGLTPKIWVSGLDVNVANGLRAQKAIGTSGNIGIGDGRCNVSGTMTAFYTGKALYDKLIANTATSIDFRVADSAGNTYIIDMPRIKYQGGAPNITGADADVELPLDFQALRDPTLGFTISISKISA